MLRRQLKVLFAPVLICSLVLARPAGVIAQGYSPDASTTAVTITLNASQVIRTIDQRMFGINTAIWDAAFDTTATRSLLQEMGVQALRFPGGSLSNEYHWATNTSRDNTWTWATSFDAFASVALTTPAGVFISVNYGSGTPQEAADWVRYANVTKGYGFKYWEIGNENYGSWEYDLHAVHWDPYTYGESARDYFTLMKAADPTIKGVVFISPVTPASVASWSTNWFSSRPPGSSHFLAFPAPAKYTAEEDNARTPNSRSIVSSPAGSLTPSGITAASF